jgi:hypothetical protein
MFLVAIVDGRFVERETGFQNFAVPHRDDILGLVVNGFFLQFDGFFLQ